MTLVSKRQQKLWRDTIKQLREDIGRTATIYLQPVESDCPWCIYDPVHKRSSGIAESGMIWNTHPDYVNPYNINVCPNCDGRGRVLFDGRTFEVKVTKKDLVPNDREDDNAGTFPLGSIRMTATLEDVLVSGSITVSGTDWNADTLFDWATRVEFEGETYQVLNVTRAGLGQLASCRVILERINTK